jgi:hypothetical protein
MRFHGRFFNSPVFKSRWAALIALLVFSFAALTARAQNLSYEGPTGIFITPTAYTAASSETAHGVDMPAVGFHFMAGGPVLGNFSTLSVTEGFAKRFEVGITVEFHGGGNDYNPDYYDYYYYYNLQSNASSMFTSDFNILHAKAIVVNENAGGNKWTPSIAVGGIYRFADHMSTDICNFWEGGDGPTYCSGYSSTDGPYDNYTYNVKATNFDFYAVATKTVPQLIPKVPVMLSLGVRSTNSALWGMAGAAPVTQGRVFGALALVIPGPAKSTITPAFEIAEQPRQMMYYGYSEDYTGGEHENYKAGVGDLPSTEAYVLRIAPSPKFKADIELGVIHLGGNIYNYYYDEGYGARARSYTSNSAANYNLDLNARARMFFGLSYKF